MSAVDRNRTYYVGPQAFDTMNENPQYKPGELGTVCVDVATGRRGQKVVVDSGCVAVVQGIGIVAAGQVAYWKDKSFSMVTNDPFQANAVNAPAGGWGNAGNPTLDGRNFVAGIFQNAVAATNATIILQRTDRATGFGVLCATANPNAGDLLVATAGAATATAVASGAAITQKTIGLVLGARSPITLRVPCWVNIMEED